MEQANGLIYLDKEGYIEYLNSIKALEKELEEATDEKREGLRQSPGSFVHDSFMIEEAAKDQEKIEQSISRREALLDNVVIVEKQSRNDIVDIDTIFTLDIDYGNGIEEETCKLVAKYNVDPNNNEISINSPLGKEVYKKKVGTKIKYLINDKLIEGVINKIIS